MTSILTSPATLSSLTLLSTNNYQALQKVQLTKAQLNKKHMNKYGLIGYPITSSFSPGYFSRKFEREGISDSRYDLYPLEQIEQFEQLSGVKGINVTIPYKELVMPYLDGLSKEAERIGAVNTIKYIDGKKIGHNTDVYGFEESLVPLFGETQPKQALVLGTGGAAKAVWYVLDRLNIPFLKVSRSKGDVTYDELSAKQIREHRLLINTTPLGMTPKVDQCPAIDYGAISSDHILFDLIYNPEKTLFLKRGAENGATIKNGLEMLELQAEKAWEIWNTP